MEPDPNKPSPKLSTFDERAYKNIKDFIRVHIHFLDETEFSLTLDVNHSLDYVARLIEAEATFRKIDYIDGNESPQHIETAVSVYQLYDAANLALPFSSKVGDTLAFDDYIFPITSADGN